MFTLDFLARHKGKFVHSASQAKLCFCLFTVRKAHLLQMGFMAATRSFVKGQMEVRGGSVYGVRGCTSLPALKRVTFCE